MRSENCHMTDGLFSRINETSLVLIMVLSAMEPGHGGGKTVGSQVGVLAGSPPPIHTGGPVLLCRCFSWRLPENGDCSHADEEG